MAVGWFSDLTGLAFDDPATVRAGIVAEGANLRVLATGRVMRAGHLTLPRLADLAPEPAPGRLRWREVVADVRDLHCDPANAGAVFQVASQTNLLEMVGPHVTPEQGIARYANDLTQGPACAMACAAGTIWRNYLVPVSGGIGQDRHRQIDTLADLAAALQPGQVPLWSVQNGYVLAGARGLAEVARQIALGDRQTLKGLVRVGVQHDTEVTLSPSRHPVTQIYCSALPIAYGDPTVAAWEPFARLVLEAAYQATFAAALTVAAQTRVRRLFLTRLGGGAFGNPDGWINDAVVQAALRYAGADLDVVMVSHGAPNAANRAIADRIAAG